jgi:hypothetical protein
LGGGAVAQEYSERKINEKFKKIMGGSDKL